MESSILTNPVSKAFWLKELTSLPGPVYYPTLSTFKESESNPIVLQESLSMEVYTRLCAVAPTLLAKNMVFNTVHALQLFQLTKQSEIVLAYQPEACLEYLPLSVVLAPEMKIKSVLLKVKDKFAAQEPHLSFPVAALMKAQTENATPIGVGLSCGTSLSGAKAERIFPVQLQYLLEENHPQVQVQFDPKKYTTESIQWYIQEAQRLLLFCLENLDKDIASIPVNSESTTNAIITYFNAPLTDFKSKKGVHELFSAIAKQNPSKIALEEAGKQMSYETLDQLSNNFAFALQQATVARGRVLVLEQASINYVVSVLGILKAGFSYVPAAMDMPVKRLEWVIQETQPDAIVLQDTPSEDHPIGQLFAALRFEDRVFSIKEWMEPTKAVALPSGPFDQKEAYVLYTSGSTGKPKGVPILHQSINRLVVNTNFASLNEKTRVLLTGATTFDATTFEIWGPLLNAGTLVLGKKEQLLSADQLNNELKDHAVNTLWLTAPLFDRFVAQGNLELFSGLEQVLVGGDALHPGNIYSVKSRYPNLRITNGYGPTENTTFSLTHDITLENKYRIPLGRCIANSFALVMDDQQHIMPVMAWGTLYVGGPGLTPGYLQDQERNNKKFISHPFIEKERLYCTEDVVRLLPDYTIEFKGRNDSQVKINGFRIELGEIEHHLDQVPGIAQGHVLVHSNAEGIKYLAAFYIEDAPTTVTQIQENLALSLPQHMLPSVWLKMEEFPLNQHGKVDAKTLLTTLEQQEQGGVNTIQGPAQEMAEIWSEVLHHPLNKIHAGSNFFTLGGHSLQAMALLTRIQERFSVKIAIATLFENADFTALWKLVEEGERQQYAQIPIAPEKESYPLTSAQQRMFVLQQILPESTAYNMYSLVQLPEFMQKETILNALQVLVGRHSVLRTTFHKNGGNFEQRVHSNFVVECEVHTLLESELVRRAGNAIRPFDLENGPLFRLTYFQTETQNGYLLLDIHHIVCDGFSMDLLLKEFDAIVHARELPAISLEYKDIAIWQQSEAYFKQKEKAKHYWNLQFDTLPSPLDLPLKLSGEVAQTNTTAQFSRQLGAHQTNAIQLFCQQNKVSKTTLFMSAFGIVLGAYANQEDLVIGLPVAGRNNHQLQGVIGMLVNTLAIRIGLDRNVPVLEYVKSLHSTMTKAFENEQYPFDALVEDLQLPRNTSKHPLFDVVLNHLVKKEASIQDFERSPFLSGNAKFDLTLEVLECSDGIGLTVTYAENKLEEYVVESILETFERVMHQMLATPSHLLSQISLQTQEQASELLELGKGPLIEIPDVRIEEQFQQIAENNPKAIALVDCQGSLTYQELNHSANAVAFHLLEQGIEPGSVIGVTSQNKKEMVIAMLAVLKVGAVFMPFDSALPTERLQYMLQTTEAKGILTDGEIELEGQLGVPLFSVSALVQANWHKTFPSATIKGSTQETAYIIFTSGTTGLPNGVEVTHKGLTNLCTWHNQNFGITPDKRGAKFAGLSFDASIWEIFPYMTAGASLYFFSDAARHDPTLLHSEIEEHHVTIAFLPTQIGQHFALKNNDSLEILLLGGEKLSQWEKRNYSIYNNYGPTENTVVSTFHLCKETQHIPIGKPIANTHVFVVQPGREVLSPMGAIGELCISSTSLAKGYLDAAKTKACFLKNPFMNQGQLYRTGDLVRWDSNGDLHFVGRTNDQIKLRGYRIELSEIESRVVQVEGVREAVAVVQEEGKSTAYIAVFYVANGPVESAGIQAEIAGFLPSYMLPNHFKQVDSIPLTRNGKVDKRKLPLLRNFAEATKEAPSTDLQHAIQTIWATVLALPKDQIGIHQNFFELGGNSIKIIQLKDQLVNELNKDITVVSLFEYVTIASLCAFFENKEVLEKEELNRFEKREEEAQDTVKDTLNALGL